jgi:hypothetical protein
MKRLLYTTRRSIALSQFVAGVGVRNPEYYSRPESDVQEVGIEGDYPQIAEDYEQLGVRVFMAPAHTSAFGEQDPDSVGIERAVGEQHIQDGTKEVASMLTDADERKLLIATLKTKGIKYARNTSTDQLRALVQSSSNGQQVAPANA